MFCSDFLSAGIQPWKMLRYVMRRHESLKSGPGRAVVRVHESVSELLVGGIGALVVVSLGVSGCHVNARIHWQPSRSSHCNEYVFTLKRRRMLLASCQSSSRSE